MSIQKEVYKVEVKFTNFMLGTAPKNVKVYDEFVASKAPDSVAAEDIAYELLSIEERKEKGMTGFRRNPETGQVYLPNFMVKGFMKEVCGNLRRNPTSESSKVKAYKSIIDGNFHVHPRTINLELPEGVEDAFVTEGEPSVRSLRASTAQGDRVALACSEVTPEGTKMEFTITSFQLNVEPWIRELFENGEYHGFGQWRSAGWGTFESEVTRIE